MKIDIKGVLADALALWRADGDLLFRIVGLFFFLPQFAMLLLLPPMPPLAVAADASEAAQLALAHSIADWIYAYGGWYLLGALVVQAGSLILLALYMQRDRPDLGSAIARAARLFPRYLLAMILVGLPLGLGAITIVLLLPGLYILGRMIALGPLLASDARPGVRGAARHSWALTRGNGLVTAALAALPILGGALLAAPFTLIDRALQAGMGQAGMGQGDAANQVAIALVDAGAAAVTAAAALAAILIQLAAYRRLAPSTGI